MNNHILLLVNGWAGQSRLLDHLMVFCASYLIYVVFAVVAGYVIYWTLKRDWSPLISFLAVLVVTFIILQLISLLNLNDRPFMDHSLTQLIPHTPGGSFPSNHTTAMAAISFGFLLVTKFKKLGGLFLVLTLLIGLSRVFVGVHYPLDILGGLVTGLIGGATVFAGKNIITNRQQPPQVD